MMMARTRVLRSDTIIKPVPAPGIKGGGFSFFLVILITMFFTLPSSIQFVISREPLSLITNLVGEIGAAMFLAFLGITM